MLSYQHAYHAGGPADLHKHAALVAMLGRLTRKPRPVTVMETHAGRGLYDLDSAESLRTGEAAEGIDLISLPSSDPFGGVLARIRARHGARSYPGSPMIAAEMLRDEDRLCLMELHPAENAALRTAMARSGAEIHRRDGSEGVLALSPPRPRRGLVLIDPSYEIKSEYAAAAKFCLRLIAKWPEATVMIWYPILRAEGHRALLSGLAPLRPLVHEVDFTLKDGRGMTGSGLAIVNAPHGFAADLSDALAPLCPPLRPRT